MKHVAIRAALAACCLGPGTGGAVAQAAGCGLFEAVEPGDTFAVISQRCGVPVDTLVAANPGIDAAAPEVASTMSLALSNDAPVTVAGGPVSPAPRIVQPPKAPQPPEAQVVIVQTERTDPVATGSVLLPLLGQWAPSAEVCADPDVQWFIEDERLSVGGDTCAIENVLLTNDAYVLDTICGGSGVIVERSFELRMLDSLTLAFLTGEQAGALKRCAPG